MKVTAETIKRARAELREYSALALRTHSKEKVVAALEQLRTKYQLTQIFSTKGGIMNTPDYDKLQVAIELIEEEIRRLET